MSVSDDCSWWHCPLINTNIEYGHCLDINYDLEDMFISNMAEEMAAKVGKTREEVRTACGNCKNNPMAAGWVEPTSPLPPPGEH